MTNSYGTPYSQPQQPAAQQPAQYEAPQYTVGQQYPSAASARLRSTKTTFGMWSLILGLSGFLLPIGLNAIAAIALGIVGIVKEQRRGMSIAGTVIGGFVLFIYVPVVWAVLALAFALSLTPLLFLPFLPY